MTLLGAIGLVNLRLSIDAKTLTPWDDSVVVRDAELRKEFLLGDPIIIFIDTETPDGMFDSSLLSMVSELSSSIAAIPGLPNRAVMSLATESRPRVYPGTLRFRPLLDPLPDTPEKMEWLRNDLRAIEILDGVLVTSNRSGTSIIVRMPIASATESSDRGSADRMSTYHTIRKLVASAVRAHAQGAEGRADDRRDAHPWRISIVGAPVAQMELGAHVLYDIAVLIPLSLLTIAIVIWTQCGRLAAVTIVLTKAGACLLFTFGLMGWAGVPIQLTSAIMAVLLTTTSISDEVFILARYQLTQRLGGSSLTPRSDRDAAMFTMREMASPATITSAMMAIGFWSLLISPLPSVARFGAFTGLGIGFCWIWSMTVTPALLKVFGARLLGRRWDGDATTSRTLGMVVRLIGLTLARPRRTLAVLVLGCLLLAMGGAQLYVQDSWTDAFSPTSQFRIDTEHADSALNGVHSLLLYLQWPVDSGSWPEAGRRQGPLLDPRVLRAIDQFEEKLRSIPSVGGVLGPASQFKAAHYLFTSGRLGSRNIPDDVVLVAKVIDSFDVARGAERRREVFHDNMHRAVVMMLVKTANFQTTARIMREVRALEADFMTPLGARIEFGGDLAISQAMIPAVIFTQRNSLLLTAVGVGGVIALLTGSWLTVALTLAPAILSVVSLLGVMGYIGVPLGVGTSMYCAMSLGVGSDFAIYYIDRSCRSLDRIQGFAEAAHGWAIGHGFDRAKRALEETAPAIWTDALAVALGLGLLGVSRIPVNARLGLMVSFTLVACALLTLVGISAYVALRGPSRS